MRSEVAGAVRFEVGTARSETGAVRSAAAEVERSETGTARSEIAVIAELAL